MPHGAPAAGSRDPDGLLAFTANTDSCFSSSVLEQLGQAGA
jgi:hypothetical protein